MSEYIKKIKLGKAQYLVIDLTQPLCLDTEIYPGDPKPEEDVFSDIDKIGYQHHVYKLGDHVFQPHGDAPKHQNPDLQDKGFEVFDIKYCFNSAFLIDLAEAAEAELFDDIRYLVEIKKEHLEPFSKQLSQRGAILIRTGYDKWLEVNKPHLSENLPYLNKPAAEFIASFHNIKVIGVDSLTIDPFKSHTSHQLLKNTLIVESLVHLHKIPKDNRLDFYLQTSPVRIVGATGGPINAYAFIEI